MTSPCAPHTCLELLSLIAHLPCPSSNILSMRTWHMLGYVSVCSDVPTWSSWVPEKNGTELDSRSQVIRISTHLLFMCVAKYYSRNRRRWYKMVGGHWPVEEIRSIATNNYWFDCNTVVTYKLSYSNSPISFKMYRSNIIAKKCNKK